MTDTAIQLTPPQSETELAGWLRLIRSRRVGPTTFFRLMAEHGQADKALAALPIVAKEAGVDDYQACPEPVAMQEIKAGRMAGGVLIPFGDPRYPSLLAELADAPPLIWALGDLSLLQRDTIGIAGARNASSVGLRFAKRAAEEIGKGGFVVASGLARGIDTAAHEGALATGTIAVMAGGVDVVYPKENAVLAEEIAEKGLRISEQPPGLVPAARHFPQRNRLISGLSRALVVIEAASKSGSLVTARNALDQGRDVMAVPGHPFDARAAGCNMLIRDGATLVRSAADVVEQLHIRSVAQPGQIGTATMVPHHDMPDPPSRNAPHANQLVRQILGAISQKPATEDEVIRALKLPASIVGPAVVQMELDGKLARRPGGKITPI